MHIHNYYYIQLRYEIIKTYVQALQACIFYSEQLVYEELIDVSWCLCIIMQRKPSTLILAGSLMRQGAKHDLNIKTCNCMI